MAPPRRIFTSSSRTRSGSLTSRDLGLVRQILVGQSFVLLPSDTCYSIAAVPENELVRARINGLLSRSIDQPISIAFASVFNAEKHVHLSFASTYLLESFSPGPITVVCPAKEKSREFAIKSTGASDWTIGVRVPDSIVERSVAALHPFGITTTAVRTADGQTVRSFDQAVALVEEASYKFGDSPWFAIEGDQANFYEKDSTVVQVTGRSASILRAGQIEQEEIDRKMDLLPVLGIGQ